MTVSAALLVGCSFAFFPEHVKAASSPYQLICIGGYQFVIATESGNLVEMMSDNNVVIKCQMS